MGSPNILHVKSTGGQRSVIRESTILIPFFFFSLPLYDKVLRIGHVRVINSFISYQCLKKLKNSQRKNK